MPACESERAREGKCEAKLMREEGGLRVGEVATEGVGAKKGGQATGRHRSGGSGSRYLLVALVREPVLS